MQEQEDGISLLRRALVAAWSEPQDDEVGAPDQGQQLFSGSCSSLDVASVVQADSGGPSPHLRELDTWPCHPSPRSREESLFEHEGNHIHSHPYHDPTFRQGSAMFHGQSHIHSPPSFLHRDVAAPVTWSHSADPRAGRDPSPYIMSPGTLSPCMAERDLLSHGETPSPDPFLSHGFAAAPHSPSSAYSEFSSMRSFSGNTAHAYAQDSVYHSPQAIYARQKPPKMMHSMYSVHDNNNDSGGYSSSHLGMQSSAAGYGSGSLSAIWNDSVGGDTYGRGSNSGNAGYIGYGYSGQQYSSNLSTGHGLGGAGAARLRSETCKYFAMRGRICWDDRRCRFWPCNTRNPRENNNNISRDYFQ